MSLNRKQRRARKFGNGTQEANPDSKYNVPLPPASASNSSASMPAGARQKGQKKGKAQPKPNAKGTWNKKKNKRPAAPILQGKAAKRARQLEKPHGDKVVQAKELWNKLRDRNSDAGSDAASRQAIVNEIMELIGNKLWDVVARHDASRVVQACFRFGSNDVRARIMDSLNGKCYELATTKYGHHLLKCVIRHGDNTARSQCIKELKGNITKLTTHATGASILELIYNGHQGHTVATKAEKKSLFQECYGREFQVFAKKSMTLGEFLEADPSRRDAVMGDLSKLLEKIISKGFHRFGFAHWLLAQYFEHCGDERQASMAPSLIEATLELASTVNGVSVLCGCIDVSPAKDRKRIVKWFRGNTTKICMHMTGHKVVMRLLDVVDDTVLTRKAIVNEMADQCEALAYDKYGVRVLLHLLAPNRVQYIGDEDAELLGRPVKNSKKDPNLRREETLGTLEKPLVDMCVAQCSNLMTLEGGAGCWLLLEVIRKWRPDSLASTLAEMLASGMEAKDKGDEMDIDDDEYEELGLLEKYHVQLLTKALIDLEETEQNTGNQFFFTKAIWSSISGRILEMATKNRTAYVVESLLKGSAVADQVREKLSSEEASLSAAAKGDDSSKSVLSVLKLMNFSTAKPAKRKSQKRKPATKQNTEEQESEKPSTRMTRSRTKNIKDPEKPALRRSTRTRKGSI